MLASRILRAAEDLLADYNEFKVDELLQQALNCSSRQVPLQQFLVFSQQIQRGGERLINGNRIRLYPQQMRLFLQNSGYSLSLPESLGSFLTDGYQGNPDKTPGTPEVQHWLASYTKTAAELANLAITLRAFGIEPLVIPQDFISVDFMVPREVINNDCLMLLEIQKVFCDLLTFLNEFLGADQHSPTLVYTSTTDPVMAFQTTVAVAYAVLQLFGGLLRVARESVELYRVIKVLREQPLMQDTYKTVAAKAEDTIKARVEAEVNVQLKSFTSQLNDHRKNELSNAIMLKMTVLVPKVAQGVSIGVSIESLPTITSSLVAQLESGKPAFNQLLEDTRKLEADTRMAVKITGGAGDLRLLSEASQQAKQ